VCDALEIRDLPRRQVNTEPLDADAHGTTAPPTILVSSRQPAGAQKTGGIARAESPRALSFEELAAEEKRGDGGREGVHVR
jgi:hypothetical protein